MDGFDNTDHQNFQFVLFSRPSHHSNTLQLLQNSPFFGTHFTSNFCWSSIRETMNEVLFLSITLYFSLKTFLSCCEDTGMFYEYCTLKKHLDMCLLVLGTNMIKCLFIIRKQQHQSRTHLQSFNLWENPIIQKWHNLKLGLFLPQM